MNTQAKTTYPTLLQFNVPTRLLIGLALAGLSTVLIVLSMPPYGVWPLALVGLLPMVLAQYRILPRRLSSLATAVTIGGIVALYIMDAFLELPNAPWYMKGMPLIFSVVIFLSDLSVRAFHERTRYRWLVLSGAIGWTGVEMIRSLIPITGTWGFAAYAYYKQPWLIQPVSIFGIFGMSLITLLFGYALGQYLLAWFDQRWRLDADTPIVDKNHAQRWLIGVSTALVAWVFLSLLLLDKPDQAAIRVAAIQPNFRALRTPEEYATNSLTSARYWQISQQSYERLIAQTKEAAADGAELIVWPEGGLSFDPQITHKQTLQALAADTDAHLVLAYGVGYRNEVTVLSPEEEFLGVYGKNHPVSFVGERSETSGTYPTYTTDLGEIGTIICYDLDFTDTARKVARNGAMLIAVPSGDWPGIAEKHYAHLVFRAVENRVAMVKADRSYDSVVIDPYGRIINSVVTKAGSQTTLVADVGTVQANPLQHYLGDWIGWLCLAGLLFFTVLNPLTKRQAKHASYF
jgi:apolipoprotein N-acyltransferase